MIIHGVTPTDDVSAVSVHQVFTKLGIKSIKTLYELLNNSLNYICYTDPIDDYEVNDRNFNSSKAARAHRKRLMMPLSTAWRLINDFKAGKILKRAERV